VHAGVKLLEQIIVLFLHPTKTAAIHFCSGAATSSEQVLYSNAVALLITSTMCLHADAIHSVNYAAISIIALQLLTHSYAVYAALLYSIVLTIV
jgi:hypothetical protein